MAGFAEQKNDDASYITCIFKAITVAAVLNTDSREPGEGNRETSEAAIAII